LIFPVGPVKPFHTQFRGKRLEVALMDAGGSKIPGVVQNDGSPGHAPVPVAICSLHFFVSEAAVMVEGKILVGFNGLFRRGR
jgi:hypothetical protein